MGQPKKEETQGAVKAVEAVVTPQPTPIPTPAPTQAPRPVAAPQKVAVAATGTKEQWMTAAGIAQSDWYYVDCVINGCEGVGAEGGWNGTQRWNTAGSGAYGLCQSLPAAKMASAGADYMTNPVTQLRWCHSYAQERYGGWANAWTFRKCVGQCWQPAWKKYQSKDHTWW